MSWFSKRAHLGTWVGAAAATVAAVVAIGAWQSSNDASNRVEDALRDLPPSPETLVSNYVAPLAVNATGADAALGYCVRPANSSGRTDSARCFEQPASSPSPNGRIRNVFDPCFLPAYIRRSVEGMYFVCVLDPWNEHAPRTVFLASNRDKAQDLAEGEERPPVWAMKLANGVRCVFVSGGTFVASDERANYDCYVKPFAKEGEMDLGRAAGFVIGFPDQSRPTWTVLYSDDNTAGSSFRMVEVLEAYK